METLIVLKKDRLCINCSHYQCVRKYAGAVCQYGFSPIDGESVSCYSMRGDNSKCGLSGKYYSPKD